MNNNACVRCAVLAVLFFFCAAGVPPTPPSTRATRSRRRMSSASSDGSVTTPTKATKATKAAKATKKGKRTSKSPSARPLSPIQEPVDDQTEQEEPLGAGAGDVDNRGEGSVVAGSEDASRENLSGGDDSSGSDSGSDSSSGSDSDSDSDDSDDSDDAELEHLVGAACQKCVARRCAHAAHERNLRPVVCFFSFLFVCLLVGARLAP